MAPPFSALGLKFWKFEKKGREDHIGEIFYGPDLEVMHITSIDTPLRMKVFSKERKKNPRVI